MTKRKSDPIATQRQSEKPSGYTLTVASPPSPPTIGEEVTSLEDWYLKCYRLLARALKRPPSVTELAQYVGRGVTPTYRALLRLEHKGRMIRTAGARNIRRFVEVVP